MTAQQLALDPTTEHVREQLDRALRQLSPAASPRVHVIVDRVDDKDGITAHGFVDGARFGAINRPDLQAVIEAAVQQIWPTRRMQ